MSVLRKAGVWLGLVEEDDGYEEPGMAGPGDWGDEPVRDRRQRYGDDYGRSGHGRERGGEYGDEDGPFGSDADDYASRGGGWETGLPPASRNRMTERLAARRSEREAGERPAAERSMGERVAADRSNVRPITRDANVRYLTEDNLALAPRVHAPERPVVAEAAERRYQITTLHPTTYREARTIGEHFREGTPVIMNLTEMEEADARRLVDFGAGLAFGLRGSMERVTNRVFLLSPANVQVTAEDKAKIAEGGFFHQR
jgi:cell division inhibitor SepF